MEQKSILSSAPYIWRVVSKNVGKKCDIVLLLSYFYFCFSTYNKTINLFNASLFTPLLVSNRKVKVANDSSSFVTDDLTQKMNTIEITQ